MTSTTPPADRRMLAIGLVLLAYLGFTGIDTSAKFLAQHGIPTLEFIFVRYGVHFALVLAVVAARKRPSALRSGNVPTEFIRALFLLASTFANFVAVQFLPLTITGSIAFTMPLMLCALSIPMLGEQVGWRRWTAILVGFAGVLVIVRPGTEAFHPAAILSLIGALCSAFYFLFTRRLAGVDSALTQQFYAALIATLCVAPFAFGVWVWPSDPLVWLAFALIGICGFAGHQVFSIAVQLAPASMLAPFAYFQIIYMALSSWLVFSQPPDLWIYLGAPIVMGSGFYIWWRERKLARGVVTQVAEMD